MYRINKILCKTDLKPIQRHKTKKVTSSKMYTLQHYDVRLGMNVLKRKYVLI